MKSNILKSLNKLEEKDVYSLILYILYRLKDSSEYSTLSELVYTLDAENLLRFITVFQGVTLKVPTIYELKNIVYGLQVYSDVELENKEVASSIRDNYTGEVSKADMLEAYQNICKVLDDTEFKDKE